MSTLAARSRLSALVLALLVVSTAVAAETPDSKPSVVEATLMPKFCWKQFLGPKFSGPGYYIPPKTCGYVTNHYCPGLIDLSRANRTIGNERRRRDALLSARTNVLYTLRGIKGYPNCPIRAHVEATLRVINRELNAIR